MFARSCVCSVTQPCQFPASSLTSRTCFSPATPWSGDIANTGTSGRARYIRIAHLPLSRTVKVTRICPRSYTGNSRYSIAWSARSRSVLETESPSALAVLRLITTSNFVGCSTVRRRAWPPSKACPAPTLRYSPCSESSRRRRHDSASGADAWDGPHRLCIADVRSEDHRETMGDERSPVQTDSESDRKAHHGWTFDRGAPPGVGPSHGPFSPWNYLAAPVTLEERA